MDNTQPFNPEAEENALERYGSDLTAWAEEGKIDPVIGRQDEIRRMVQILSRRTKNNPVLIGEPGTGKTTVVEGLAKRIVEGDVPENLKGKQLVALDLSAMVAGAMYRGQFEERLKNFVKEVVDSDGRVIVFIDELHTIVGAGALEGQMDVANMIKPELARGRMKVIGATTLGEYQKYIEKDGALERRFQRVLVDEPSVEDTVTILRGIKDKYEVHHGLRIQDAALISAATLSDRYITERFLPDKAVDLMDEAAAKLRMEANSAPEEIDTARRHLLQLEVEQEALNREKDRTSRDRLAEVKDEIGRVKGELARDEEQWAAEKKEVLELQRLTVELEELRTRAEQVTRKADYQQAAELQYSHIPAKEAKIDTLAQSLLENRFLKLEVGPEDIAEIVAKWTGIPVSRVLAGEREKLLHLEELLGRRVMGQDHAIKRVADVIRMSKMGVLDPDRPLGSFMFLGSTGVGKTELAKTLAAALFDDERNLVRIDMSEYMELHSVSKIMGSPPGYVGYEEGGQLTETIRRRPYSVVLFDEIEKAHPNVLNILLQILDEGRITDAKGRSINFRNTIIILTSNLDTEGLLATLRPEFINRIDEIIPFHDLEGPVIREIIDLQLCQLQTQLDNSKVTVSIDASVPEHIFSHAFQPDYGARPIQRYIKRDLLARIADFMLQHPDSSHVSVAVQNGEIRVGRVEAPVNGQLQAVE